MASLSASRSPSAANWSTSAVGFAPGLGAPITRRRLARAAPGLLRWCPVMSDSGTDRSPLTPSAAGRHTSTSPSRDAAPGADAPATCVLHGTGADDILAADPDRARASVTRRWAGGEAMRVIWETKSARAAVGRTPAFFAVDDDDLVADIWFGRHPPSRFGALAGALCRREPRAATTSAMATSSLSELDERLRALAPARVDAGARPDQGALFDLLAELAAATRGSDPREVKERQRSLEESLLRVACGEWAGPAVRRSAADVLAALFVVGASARERPRPSAIATRRSRPPLFVQAFHPRPPRSPAPRPPHVHLPPRFFPPRLFPPRFFPRRASSHTPPPNPLPLRLVVSQATPWRCTRA